MPSTDIFDWERMTDATPTDGRVRIRPFVGVSLFWVGVLLLSAVDVRARCQGACQARESARLQGLARAACSTLIPNSGVSANAKLRLCCLVEGGEIAAS